MDSIAAEKATAMRRYRRLLHLATALRCLEAVAALFLLSWSSSHLPAAARVSADVLRRLFAILVGHRFVFFLGNAIVLLLVAKSGHLSASSDPAASDDDLYNQFLETRGRMPAYAPPPAADPAPTAAMEVVFEDKNVCIETATTARVCRRSKSEKRQSREAVGELRRSETDLGRRAAAEAEAEDAEEFRRTVEAFIEKRNLFLREESMAIVCSAGPPQLVDSDTVVVLNENGVI